MKKILILVGGENQVPLIHRAKSLNYKVVLCDYRNNVPGIKYSDYYYQIDVNDIGAVIEVGRKEKIDGIITNSEPCFLSMSKVAGELGLRCMDEKTTRLYKDKHLMREFCTEYAITTPKYLKCGRIDEALIFFKGIQKKCIIKPLDNSASRGVFSINCENDILEHFEECINQSSPSNPNIIIEEYIQGTEFTVDSIKTLERNYTLAISEKKHYSYNENVAYQLLFSNQNDNYNYNDIRYLNDRLVELTDLPFGLTHAEYKFKDGKFYLVEIQARGGGNFIATDIVPYISGIDSYSLLIQWAVGENVNINYEYTHLSQKCGLLYFFDCPETGGIVKRINGLNYLDSIKNIMTYELHFKVGDIIKKVSNDAARIGYYILKCSNIEELFYYSEKIQTNFKIELE